MSEAGADDPRSSERPPPDPAESSIDAQPGELLAALMDDFTARFRRGENPSIEEYARTNLALASEIRQLFPALLIIENASDHPGGNLAPPGERVGAMIGRYRLLERIGEGGFGVVFMAEQQEPIRRKVAVKVIKPGVDTAQVIARFEAERQALAMMDHENIAKVLDAGATESGRPYFVMELVHGVPITEYCDKNRLAPADRLRLFERVCAAVQHAHTKGVIHRDIKPSNVLVTLHDGLAVPKVIDFGVAKATGRERLTDRTLFTQFAQLVGTPLYMSPEQAEMSGLDVDTRSDVYSLGVLLYELLTGTTPFDIDRLKQAAVDEVRRIIREEEPPTPSTRISRLGDKLATISARCRTDPKRLGQLVRGELDWIVMKALEKDRTRRYETAAGFAADVERYLSDQPVQAGPPSAWYRGQKFARRNRLALTLVVVAICTLIAAVVWQARNNRRLAREQAHTIVALSKAQDARRRAREAFDHLSSDIIGDWLSRQAALTEQQKSVLELALRRYEQFASEAQDAPEERFAMARAYWRVADFRAQLGMRQESDAAYARGIEVYGALATQFPAEPKYASELGKIHINQSASLQRVGAFDQSITSCEAACRVLEPLTARYPEAAEYAIDLAGAYCNVAHMVKRGKEPAAALPWYDRAIGRLEPLRHRTEPKLQYANMFLSNALRGRAGLLEDLGRLEEAVGAHETARGLREQMVAQSPDPQYVRELGESHQSLALVYAKLGRTGEAIKSFETAIAVLAKLVKDRPGMPQFIDDLADAHASMAEMQMSVGRPADARWSFETARDLRERLARANPGEAALTIGLAGAECNLANALKASGNAQAALEPYQRAIDALVPLAQNESPPGKARWFLRNSYSGRSDAMVRLGRHAEALDHLDRAIALDDRANPSYRVRRAAVLVHLGRHADAAAATDEVVAIKDLSPEVAFDAGCVQSLCATAFAADTRLAATQRQDLVELHSARAVVLLRQAVTTGYTNVDRLRTDTDLDRLRQRDDFKKLIIEAEAKVGPTSKPDRAGDKDL